MEAGCGPCGVTSGSREHFRVTGTGLRFPRPRRWSQRAPYLALLPPWRKRLTSGRRRRGRERGGRGEAGGIERCARRKATPDAAAREQPPSRSPRAALRRPASRSEAGHTRRLRSSSAVRRGFRSSAVAATFKDWRWPSRLVSADVEVAVRSFPNNA